MFARKGTIINVNETAKLLSVSPVQVRIMVRRKDLYRVQKGEHYVIPYESMKLFLSLKQKKLIKLLEKVKDASAKTQARGTNHDSRRRHHHRGARAAKGGRKVGNKRAG